MPRNLLAADAGPAPLQFTAGATIAGEFAQPFGGDSPWQDPADDAAWWDAAAGSAPDDGALWQVPVDADGPPSAHLMMAAAASENAAASYGGASSGATLLDSECAALEILISLLEGQLQSMYDAQAASDNPGYGGMLQDQIDAVQASLASAYETLATLDCEASGSAGGSSSDPWEGGTHGATFGDGDGMSQWGSDAAASDGGTWWATSGSDTGYSDGYSAPEDGGITGFSDGDSWFEDPEGASDGASDAGYSWGGEDGSGADYGTTWDSAVGASGGGSDGSDAGEPGDGDPGGMSGGMSDGSDWGESGGNSDAGNGPAPANINGNYAIENLKAGPAPYAWKPTPGTVPEGQYLHVTGRVTVPLFAHHDSMLLIQADTNFDGQFNAENETILIDIPAYSGLDFFDVSFWIPDDGPAPGNGTSSDTINVRATLNDDIVATTSATILNVAPHIASRPTLTTQSTEDGKQEAVVTVTFFDPSATDRHTVTVRWGDGTETTVTEDLSPTDQQGYCPTKTIVVTRLLTDDTMLRPATITVSDDDGGKAIYQIGSLDVALNNDDDNENSRPDYQEAGFPEEDDLVELSLAELLNGDTDWDSGSFELIYDDRVIRIWDSESKTIQILPTIVTDTGWTLPTSTGIPYTGQETVWVEGLSLHTTTVSLLWNTDELLGAEDHGLPTLLGDFRVTVWGIDLDIDSDNNNGFDLPDNSDWEEYLEDNEYGIGKLVHPGAPQFTPARIRLQRGLDPNDQQVRITLDFNPHGVSGVLHVWNTPKFNPNKINMAVEDGGNRLFPSIAFTLGDLNYDPASGGITIFLDAFQESGNYRTKKDVDTRGKPFDQFTATITGLPLSVSDTVTYLIAEADTFFPALVESQTIRNAMASEGVHVPANLPQFGLKRLSPDDYDDLEIPENTKALLGQPANVPGFKNAIYWDHVSDKYILSFAGTDDLHDVLVDVWQGLGEPTDQYNAAMEIADALSQIDSMYHKLLTTGHSLGGGLASAAAVVGNIPADTFNAAGLLRQTLLDDNGLERYPGSLQRHDSPKHLVSAYFLDYDILSFIQDKTPLQDAIGTRIEMDGPLDFEITISAAFLVFQLSSGAGWLSVAANLGQMGYLMGLAHSTKYYHYGLLVNESTGWDIYGYSL